MQPLSHADTEEVEGGPKPQSAREIPRRPIPCEKERNGKQTATLKALAAPVS